MLWHPWDWDFDSLAVFQILSHLPLHYVSPHLNSLFSLASCLLDMTENIFEIRSITVVICRVAWLKVYLECSSGNNQSLPLVLTGPLNVHHALLISELTHYWPSNLCWAFPQSPPKKAGRPEPLLRGEFPGHSCTLFHLTHASSTLPTGHSGLAWAGHLT